MDRIRSGFGAASYFNWLSYTYFNDSYREQ